MWVKNGCWVADAQYRETSVPTIDEAPGYAPHPPCLRYYRQAEQPQRIYKNVAVLFEAENVTDEKRIERERAADGTTSRKVEEAGGRFCWG